MIRIALGRERFEHPRFVAMRSHYGYDSFFCAPGLEGAHEKGGVEGEGGRFRRRHLVPIPVVATIGELNQRLQAADVADDARRIGHRTHTVGEDFAAEQPHLLPLPAERFDAARLLPAHRVDHKARICVRQPHYSVPARFAGRTVNVRLGATFLEVRAGGQMIARHERSVTKGGESLVLDHYLEVLVRKPGALPGATALAQAREQGAFTPTHEAFWTACRRKHGDAVGTRALIEVLLAHRHLPAPALIQAMRQAVDAGVTGVLNFDHNILSPDHADAVTDHHRIAAGDRSHERFFNVASRRVVGDVEVAAGELAEAHLEAEVLGQLDDRVLGDALEGAGR